jgi:hypothetical protein
MKTFEQGIKKPTRCTVCFDMNPCVRASALEDQGKPSEREIIAYICEKCFNSPMEELKPVDYEAVMRASQRRRKQKERADGRG